ncbi:hypothetical protein O3M35_007493 [Rhynocoris fuscipes]|uniref:Adenylyltransferase and sulfurtransferase MOCS3 homolog n=1 Tax=Rhynocoris fuscipes TaxID=488301 RepID=A0AAW1D9L6_9HEMI
MEAIDYILKKQTIQKEILALKAELREKEEELLDLIEEQKNHTLSNHDIAKYSRQIIVPGIGVKGQERIKSASVLIVGCGGLGCPAAQYLVGCGIGRIGLVDYDDVEENNLHRQLLHLEDNIGMSKVKSASQALKKLNSDVKVDEYKVQLDSNNALEIISNYDIIVDATDNVATRYLINDACVITGKPLVSGSAVRTEGQLTVLNYKNGPCYRCLFPEPPPPEAVSNCGDAGVLGPIPGVIGVLQALQVIYIIVENNKVLSKKLLLFDGIETNFRTVKLREKMKSCSVCGESPTIVKLIDYEQFCGAPANDKDPALKLLQVNDRLSPEELYKKLMSESPPVIVDVRSELEFQICKIPTSINIPLEDLTKQENSTVIESKVNADKNSSKSVCIVCRRGNDSQIGVTRLKKLFNDITLYDLKGGLHAWARVIDNSFPIY